MTKLRRSIFIVLFLIFFQMVGWLGWTATIPQAQAADKTNSQIIFQVNNSLDQPLVALKYTLSGVSPLLSPNTYLGNLPLGLDAETQAVLMNLDPLVVAASANYSVGYLEGSSSFNFDPHSFNFDGSSSDSAIGQARNQWAWQRTGLLTVQKASWGQGVKVAVLDTGVDYTHPDLSGKILPGYDAVGNLPDGMDVQGHGTFVAGVITQIAPAAKIIPVRVLDANGMGTVATITNGLQFAINAGAKVVNLSLSSTYDFKTLHQLIQQARSRGIVVISAAGNDSSDKKYFPAAYSEGTGIGATDTQDYKASFSNYNGYISLSAPGVDIYSNWKGGGYGWGNGTSFSTPMAAAGVAVISSLHPTYNADQLKNVLRKAVDHFGAGCKCNGLGVGRLNFAKLS